MVILRRKQKIKQLEAAIEEVKELLKSFIKEQEEYKKNNDEQIKELEETINNMADDNSGSKSAQQLMREYFYGKEDK